MSKEFGPEQRTLYIRRKTNPDWRAKNERRVDNAHRIHGPFTSASGHSFRKDGVTSRPKKKSDEETNGSCITFRTSFGNRYGPSEGVSPNGLGEWESAQSFLEGDGGVIFRQVETQGLPEADLKNRSKKRKDKEPRLTTGDLRKERKQLRKEVGALGAETHFSGVVFSASQNEETSSNGTLDASGLLGARIPDSLVAQRYAEDIIALKNVRDALLEMMTVPDMPIEPREEGRAREVGSF